MVNKTISITWELNEKLKSESNASALIVELLKEHYKIDSFKNSTVEDVEKNLKEIEENRKKILEQLKKEESNFITKKELIKQQTEFLEKSKEEVVIKEKEKLENIKRSFYEFLGRNITDKEMEEYLKRMETEPGFSMYIFIDEKENKPEEEADIILKEG